MASFAKMASHRWQIGIILLVAVLIQTVDCLNVKYRILEELLPGTDIGNIQNDANLRELYGQSVLDRLRFSILAPDNDNNKAAQYFTVDERTGTIRLLSSIDRDSSDICASQDNCVMTFDVVISPAAYFLIVNVQIEILDINDHTPSWAVTEYRLNVSESALPGSTFNLPSVIDPDSSAYSIKNFEIRPNTGQFQISWTPDLNGRVQPKLQLLTQLDREDVSLMDLSVLVFDSGSPPSSASLLVHLSILDTNDNDPEFDLPVYETRINEDARVGSPVVTIHARDPDEGLGGSIRYRLTSQTLGETVSKFQIDPVSGVIHLAQAVDREEQHVYDMQVIARDMAVESRSASAAVTVFIDDVNDNAPVIRLSVITSTGRAEVSEAAEMGTFVALLSVTDRDSGQNAEVDCRLSSNKFGMQIMQPQNKFKIVTESRLDRETQSEYKLTVSCEDRGVPTQMSRDTFTVYVTDVNDHAPEFSEVQYEAQIPENAPRGINVIRVVATDADIDNNSKIEYRLLDDSRGRFVINSDTGVIQTNAEFDFEEARQIRLEVEARDLGVPLQRSVSVVIVTVTDANDQPPVFSKSAYTISVKENTMVGAIIGDVYATDKDTGEFNSFVYSLQAEHGEILHLFGINPTNGSLSLLKSLDREKQPIYRLNVIATNTVPPKLSGSATITIFVDDINDNSPIVDFPNTLNNTVTISNRLPPGYKVAQIQAHDLDTGDNAELSYFLVFGRDVSQRFGVDPKSGEVFLNHDISQVKLETYHVVVLVKDKGSPEHSTHANLTIIVNQSAALVLDGEGIHNVGESQASKNMLIIIIVVAVSGVVIIVLLASIVFVLLTSRRKAANGRAAAASIVLDTIESASNCGSSDGSREGKGKPLIKPSSIDLNDIAVLPEKNHLQYVTLSKQPSLNLSNNASGSDHRSPIHNGKPPVPPRGVSTTYSRAAPADTSFNSDESEQTKHELMSLTSSISRRPLEADRASASSAEDSVTDSGRGASEEGEHDDHRPPRLPPKQPRIGSPRRPAPEPNNNPYYNSGHPYSQASNPPPYSHIPHTTIGPRGKHADPTVHMKSYNTGPSTSQSEVILKPNYDLSHLHLQFDPHYGLKYNDPRHGYNYTHSNDVTGKYAPNSDVERYAPTSDVLSLECAPDYSDNSQENVPLSKQTVRDVKAKDKNKKMDYVTSAISNSSLMNRYRSNQGEKSSSANSLTGNSFSDANLLLKYKAQGGSTCSDLTDATSVTSATSGSYVIDQENDARGLNYSSLAATMC